MTCSYLVTRVILVFHAHISSIMHVFLQETKLYFRHDNQCTRNRLRALGVTKIRSGQLKLQTISFPRDK